MASITGQWDNRAELWISDIRNYSKQNTFIEIFCESDQPYLRGLDPIYTYRADLRILNDKVFESKQKLMEVRPRIHPIPRGHRISSRDSCDVCTVMPS